MARAAQKSGAELMEETAVEVISKFQKDKILRNALLMPNTVSGPSSAHEMTKLLSITLEF